MGRLKLSTKILRKIAGKRITPRVVIKPKPPSKTQWRGYKF